MFRLTMKDAKSIFHFMNDFNEPKQLIQLWPDYATFGGDIGVSESAVKAMARRNTIDQKHLWDIYNAARDRNIHLPADQILKVVSRKKDTSKQEGGEIAA